MTKSSAPITVSCSASICILVTILALGLGVFLRFAWVAEQGFMGYDEGWLVESAASMAAQLRGASRNIYVDFKSSPVTIFLTALPIAIFGESSATIMYPPALLGLLGVICSALVAHRLYGQLTALITLVLGAVSPMQVLFSRTAAIDSPGFFFLGMSYLAIMLSMPRKKLCLKEGAILLGSGALLGLSLAANYRCLSCLFIPSLIIIIREGAQFEALKKLCIHIAGFILCLALIDVVIRLAYPYPLSDGFYGAFKAQYQHISSKSFGHGGVGLLPSLHIKDGWNLLLSLMDLDNTLMLVLGAVWVLSFPLLMWQGSNRLSDLQLGAIVIVPIFLFSMLTQTAARGATVTQPFFALAAARCIVALAQLSFIRRFGRAPRLVLTMLVAIPTATGFYKSIQPDVLGTRNAFDLAFQETCVKYKTGLIVELDRGPGFYAKRLNCKTSSIGGGVSHYGLAKRYFEGYRFWLIDGQFSVYRDNFKYLWPSFENRQPDFFIPAETYIRLDHFTSHAFWLGTTYKQERKHYEEWIGKWGARLPVFDLSKHITPLGWKGSSEGWYRVGGAIVSMPSSGPAKDELMVTWDSSNSGTGAVARFNLPDYIDHPIHVGVGMCESTPGNLCNGFGVFTIANNAGLEMILIELTLSRAKELAKVTLPNTWLNRTSKLWVRCVGQTLTAGYDSTTVINQDGAWQCRNYSPAFVAKADTPVEALELASLS